MVIIIQTIQIIIRLNLNGFFLFLQEVCDSLGSGEFLNHLPLFFWLSNAEKEYHPPSVEVPVSKIVNSIEVILMELQDRLGNSIFDIPINSKKMNIAKDLSLFLLKSKPRSKNNYLI